MLGWNHERKLTKNPATPNSWLVAEHIIGKPILDALTRSRVLKRANSPMLSPSLIFRNASLFEQNNPLNERNKKLIKSETASSNVIR